MKLGCIVIAGYLFDSQTWGRRNLLIGSQIIVAISLVALGFSFAQEEAIPSVSIFSLALFYAFFSLGLGPGAWLVPSEVFSLKMRAKSMSAATAVNRIIAIIVSGTFVSLQKSLGSHGVFFLYASLTVGNIIFVAAFVPETRGRSLEDISAYFGETATTEESCHSSKEGVVVTTTAENPLYSANESDHVTMI